MLVPPSLVRLALDFLLSHHPGLDLVSVDWQIEREPAPPFHSGPWCLVTLGQPSDDFQRVPAYALWEFAIWKHTGAVHAMRGGMVLEPELWRPS